MLKRLISPRLKPVKGFVKYVLYTKITEEDDNGHVEVGGEWETTILESPMEYEMLLSMGYDFCDYTADEDIRRGLECGAVLVCIFKKKKLAHTTWVAQFPHQSIYDSLFKKNIIKLDSAGFIGPCNTYPEYRGCGLYPYALRLACKYLASRGCKRVLINSRATNQASRRGIEKVGFRLCGVIKVLWMLGKKFIYVRLDDC